MTSWDASKPAAGNRLPPPKRPPQTLQLVVPPRIARASIPPAVERPAVERPAFQLPSVDLDEPTVRDAPPLPPPPVVAQLAIRRRQRSPEPTQIVAPLPPPLPPRPLGALESYGRILDSESTGGRVSGEVKSTARLPSGPMSWRRIVVGLAGGAMLVGAVVGLVIGRWRQETPSVERPGAAQRAAQALAEAAAPEEITIEEVPQPARADLPSAQPSSAEPPENAEPPPGAEPAVAKPARSRHRASSATTPRPTTHHRSVRSSKSLTYDPDALFLKRP